MMRIVVVLLGIAVLLPAATVQAHEGTAVSVTGDVRSDGPIDIEGEDFAAGDVVRIELRKDGVEPIELGRVPVEDDGSFAVTLHVPADVQPGLYQLAADGEESATFDLTVLDPAEGRSTTIEPTEAAEPVSNDRPSAETLGLAIFTGVIAAAGAALLWASRTRPHAGGA